LEKKNKKVGGVNQEEVKEEGVGVLMDIGGRRVLGSSCEFCSRRLVLHEGARRSWIFLNKADNSLYLERIVLIS
jgi:hypothetical protein